MHLDNRFSMINTRKRKVKITKAKMAELELRWRQHNKKCKQNNMHHMKYETLDDYIDYCYGKIKRPDPREYSISVAWFSSSIIITFVFSG